MSYQEKENIVNIFSGLLITAVYALIIYQRQLDGRIDLTGDFRSWGIVFLIFIGVSIISRIIIYIIFHIINAIATRDVDIPVSDERVKLIKLKSLRNSHHTFSVGCLLMFAGLALGMQVFWIFIGFVVFGELSEIVDNASQIYYSRKGV